MEIIRIHLSFGEETIHFHHGEGQLKFFYRGTITCVKEKNLLTSSKIFMTSLSVS